MTLNFSSILTRAWQITWKFRILWIFGFLAMLGGSGGWGGYNGGSGANFNWRTSANVNPVDADEYPTRWNTTSDLPPEWRSTFDQLAQIKLSTWITIAVVACCVLCLIGLALWLISIIGRGGLIGGILAADADGKVTFREAWGIGVRNFWKLLLIRIMAFLLWLALSLILIVPALFVTVFTCGLGFIPWVCVMIVFGIAVNVWFALMDYAVVAEKLGVGEAIGRAWVLLRKYIGPLAILYIILLAISLGIGLALMVVFAPSAAAIVVSVLPVVLGEGSLNMTWLIVGLVLFALSVLISITVRSVLRRCRAGVQGFQRRNPVAVRAGGHSAGCRRVIRCEVTATIAKGLP
jgi:hypothetical protein